MLQLQYKNFKIELQLINKVTIYKNRYFCQLWDLDFQASPIFCSGDLHLTAKKRPEAMKVLSNSIDTFISSPTFKNLNETQAKWFDNCQERVKQLCNLVKFLDSYGELAEKLYYLANNADLAWEDWSSGYPVILSSEGILIHGEPKSNKVPTFTPIFLAEKADISACLEVAIILVKG